MADLKLFGVDKLSRRLKAIVREMPQECGQALYAEALDVQRLSMRNTPVDTGALRASHVTTEPDFNGRDVSVRVEVGGPAAPYALLVHEDLTAHHPVGGAKYLERAAHARERGMGARIAKRVRAMIERKAAS